MYNPKFRIGQLVKIENYEIYQAIVAGVMLYFEVKGTVPNFDLFADWVKFTNGCDYEVLYYNEDNEIIRETFNEKFLEAL
jgi:hypothetical protein